MEYTLVERKRYEVYEKTHWRLLKQYNISSCAIGYLINWSVFGSESRLHARFLMKVQRFRNI